MIDDSKLDAMLDNLEQAKQIEGDGRERGRQKAQQASQQTVTDTTDEEYRQDANYRFSCPECDWEAYRKQARGKVREIVNNPERGECRACGAIGLAVETV